MEVKDKLKPYLGTETILIIDNNEHYLKIYNKINANYLTEDFFYKS